MLTEYVGAEETTDVLMSFMRGALGGPPVGRDEDVRKIVRATVRAWRDEGTRRYFSGVADAVDAMGATRGDEGNARDAGVSVATTSTPRGEDVPELVADANSSARRRA